MEADKSDEAVYKLDATKGRIDLVWKGPRGETKTTKTAAGVRDVKPAWPA